MKAKNLLTVVIPTTCNRGERMKLAKISWSLCMLTAYFLTACGSDTSNTPIGTSKYALDDVNSQSIQGPSQNTNDSHCTDWWIMKPIVNQSSPVAYPQIWFNDGDQVAITVGGCAQTGGSGATWKRYCDPLGDNSGPDSGGLYYGLISLPGATAGLVPIKYISSVNLDPNHPDPNDKLHYSDVCVIQATVSAGYLILGYKDGINDYGDNGYWGPDNGNYDQCKDGNTSSRDANLEITICPSGITPVPHPPYTGIAPDDFRCSAAWQFHNFGTSRLSWDSFKDAFDFEWYDYLNPVTYIMYVAGMGMAAPGNCLGMSLLSVVGEDNFGAGDLTEYFWSNYPYHTMNPPQVEKDINTTHWKQLSTYFISKWIASRLRFASTVASSIQQDLSNGNYGLLSLTNGFDGHVVVPLSVQLDGSKYTIQVYDSNSECITKPDYSTHNALIVDGDSWSFENPDRSIWTAGDGDIAYIPYQLSGGWRQLLNGGLETVLFIFGSNTTVEQMTDKNGRQLFKNSNPQGLADIDTSANGLGNDIARIPILGWGHPIPRNPGPPFVLTSPPEPDQYIDTTNQMIAEYEPDYGFSGQFYLVQNLQLEQLGIQLSNSDPNNPVRALINLQGQWYEVKCDGAGNGAAINPSLTMEKMSDLTRSFTVRERNGVPMKCQFVHGLLSMVDQNITIQKADAVDVGTGTITAQINKDNSLQLFTTGQEQQININTRVIDSTGTTEDMPVRTQTLHPKITCPSDITVECSASGGTPASDPTIAAFLSGAQATDNCECVPTISNSAPDFFPSGSTKVVWTATDANNNVDPGSICSANVTVVDTTPPVITCPPSIVVNAVNASGAPVSFAVTASDNCSTPIVNSTSHSGDMFPIGITTVTSSATDAASNTAQCNFTITVNGPQNIEKYVLLQLRALRPTVTDKVNAFLLDYAIQKLVEALNPTLWIDDTHLKPKGGEGVFNADIVAVLELTLLVQKNGSLTQVLKPLIDLKLHSTRILVEEVLPGASKLNLLMAQKMLAAGDAVTYAPIAIGFYEIAWNIATH